LNSRNKSETNRTASNVELNEKRAFNFYNQYNKQIHDKIKAREANTKLVSKSFINERESKKENLRQSIEKEACFIHKENKDFIKEKANNRTKQTEKIQLKLSKLASKPKPRVDEYYNKYVE
jgi:hypothetical protein